MSVRVPGSVLCIDLRMNSVRDSRILLVGYCTFRTFMWMSCNAAGIHFALSKVERSEYQVVYAIVRAGGRQEKVAVGDIVTLDRVRDEIGDTIEDDATRDFIRANNRFGYDELIAKFNEARERGYWQPRSNSAHALLDERTAPNG